MVLALVLGAVVEVVLVTLASEPAVEPLVSGSITMGLGSSRQPDASTHPAHASTPSWERH